MIKPYPAQYCASIACLLLSLLLAPLLFGIINRVKAKVAGRQGRPLLQLYFDINKLLRKNSVYPQTSTRFFRIAPVAGVAAALAALLMLPFGGVPAVLSFPGDFIVMPALLAFSRYMLILAALDTGSAFEGMGAARESLFSAMAEPILIFCLMVLAYASREYSLSLILGGLPATLWLAEWPMYLLLAIALFLLLLVENSRIPVDDPNTHLELTMIHEVMILDHSGPDLALLEYSASLKLWIFCLIISGIAIPQAGVWGFAERSSPAGSFPSFALEAGTMLLMILCIAALVGCVESAMARLRLERVPQVLTLAGSFACLAALSLWR
ncbi:MAG: NADH-quinone oxidoreductase subunit H [Desulfovibrio sp.]|jgi:formate hydrogenlyase subunit 4|nr:NADH-quinone oxidoreductase subunit H [Desulfovibrio sp.]